MKKKFLIAFPLVAITLCGCSKTDELYNSGAYNSPIFDENYYTERQDIDLLKVNEISGYYLNLQSHDGLAGLLEEDKENYTWSENDRSRMFGYNNNLDKIEPKFSYGILSKLYDGRVRCDGLYQKSRVQLNKTGYATYFPKTLVESKYFAFACRGGTTLETPHGEELEFNFKISFFIHNTNSDVYTKIVYSLNNVKVQTDNGGSTNLVSFYFPAKDDLNGAVAMSFEWECIDPLMDTYNLSDNYQDKEKEHLALMLYEVFLGKSTWF